MHFRRNKCFLKHMYKWTSRVGTGSLLTMILVIFSIMVSASPALAAAPQAIFTAPASNQTGVGSNTIISVTFDSDMNPASFNNTNFYVKTSTGASVTPAATNGILYNAPTRTAVFTPAASLLTNTTYTVTLTTAVQNTSGAGLTANYAWSFTTGAAPYVNPHGNYITKTAACSLCHQTHTADGSYLLKQPNQTAVCFTCHNGTGSSYNEQAQFNPQSPMVKTSYHQVKNTGNSSYTGVLECTNCHNPHGDSNGSGSIYSRLLKSYDGSNYYYSGNAFCLACHGTLNQNFPGDPNYYANTGGDHNNPNAAHYNTGKSVLLPPSGTQITCVQCHDKHSGVNDSLLDSYGTALCFECHNNAANSMDNINIQADFSQTSYHDVFGNTAGDQLSCISCHGPHTVAAAKLSSGQTFSDISDPNNTKNPWTITSSGATTYNQAETYFCLTCHGPNPPVAGVNQTGVVPLTIKFASTNFTTNNGNNGNGWDKSTFTSSVHFLKGLGCNSCHNAHGSPYSRLQSRQEDTATINGECLYCHGGNPPAQFSTAPNVKTDLTSTGSPSPDLYRHPTLYVTGVHSDTENYAGLSPRQASCLDCHDPHNEQPVTNVNAPPNAPPPLKNVSGLDIDYSQAGGLTWSNWSTTNKVWTFKKPIVYQYQLCFKCHSSYSWGTTPPTPSGSIPETDIPQEFNPNNPSYHAVVGSSKIPTFKDSTGVTHYYGKFNTANLDSSGQPWNATSRLFCEDCHRSATSGLRGPHGSSWWYILNAPWTPNNGAEGQSGTGTANTQNHLCFTCHDYNFYANGDPGSDTVRSQFSGEQYPYNLHAQHAGRGCTSCHVMIVHGYMRESLLVQASDPAPYNANAWLETYNFKTPGNWMQNDCNHGTIQNGPNKGQSCG